MISNQLQAIAISLLGVVVIIATAMMMTAIEKIRGYQMSENSMSMNELIDYMPGYEWIMPEETDEEEVTEDEAE